MFDKTERAELTEPQPAPVLKFSVNNFLPISVVAWMGPV